MRTNTDIDVCLRSSILKFRHLRQCLCLCDDVGGDGGGGGGGGNKDDDNNGNVRSSLVSCESMRFPIPSHCI